MNEVKWAICGLVALFAASCGPENEQATDSDSKKEIISQYELESDLIVQEFVPKHLPDHVCIATVYPARGVDVECYKR